MSFACLSAVGRAWLYMALKDHLLESYIQCIVDNQQLMQRFYVKEALVLDHQVHVHNVPYMFVNLNIYL